MTRNHQRDVEAMSGGFGVTLETLHEDNLELIRLLKELLGYAAWIHEMKKEQMELLKHGREDE